LSTLLLEQHNLPGEYATSFVRGRFEFETSLHELPDMRSQKDTIDVIDYLLDDARLDIEFIPIPEAYRVILPDKKVDVTVPFGIDNFIDTVSREVPGSRKTISDYINLCREINEGFKYLGENRGNISYRRFFKEHGNFIRTSARTMEKTADALGLTEKIKNIIYPYWCYLGVPESRLSFSIWASMLYAYISSGATIPKLRSHEMAAAFINKIEESGGTVELNTEVKKILVKGNSIYGIETRDGKTIMVKSIISNASPTLIFNSLISPKEAVPAQALRNIRTRTHGLSLVVYLGLKAANPDCSPPGTTILSITAGFRPEAWDSIIPRALSVEDENYINGLEFCGGFSYRAHGYGSSILSGKDAFISSLKHLKSAGAEK